MSPTENGTTTTPPPVAERDPRTTPIHGTELHDDYAWLRDKGAQRVTAYLEAENAYTAANMAGTEELQKSVYDEILSHIQEDDSSVPYRDGAWEYITRTEKGQQYARYCRRPFVPGAGPHEAAETVILDVNELADGPALHVRRRLGALTRRPPARLHHGQHRLSPVHAPHQEPRHRTNSSPTPPSV